MIICLKNFIKWIQFFILFILCTLLLYQLISYIADVFKPDILYKEPSGGAIKVFSHDISPIVQSPMKQIADRYLLFFWLEE